MTDEKITNYIAHYSPVPFPVLKSLEKEAKALEFPIIGPSAARLLRHYAELLQAKNVFECGSGFGYSALWFAAGMKEGKIICTDLADKNLQKAKFNFKEAKVPITMETRCGNSTEILRSYREQFDIIFVDVDKFQYVDCFEVAWPRVKKGGLLIADNMLWGGRVFDETPGDASTEGIKLFTRRVFNEKDLHATIIPVDDGLLVARKV